MKKRKHYPVTWRKAAVALLLVAAIIVAVTAFLTYSASVKAQQSNGNGDNASCGNGKCDVGELCITCPADCGTCSASNEAGPDITRIFVGTFGVILLILIVIFVFIYFIFKRWKTRRERFGTREGTYGVKSETTDLAETPAVKATGWTITDLGGASEQKSKPPGKGI